MKIPVDTVLKLMQSQNRDESQIRQAEQDLPRTVDTEEDRGKLEKYGIDLDQLAQFLPDDIATQASDLSKRFGL